MENNKDKSKARKTSSNPTRVYTYGAFLPKDPNQEKIINDQIFNGFKYKNKLIEIERNRRNKFRQLRMEISPELKDLHEQCDNLNKLIKETYNEYGGRDENKNPIHPKHNRQNDEVTLKIKNLKSQKDNLYKKISLIYKEIEKKYFNEFDEKFKQLKEIRIKNKAQELNKENLGPNDPIRHKIVEDLLAELKAEANEFWGKKAQISAEAKNETEKARANCNCCVGSYLDIEKAIQQSFSKVKFQPKFIKWDEYNGKVGIQLTKDKGLSIQKALNLSDAVLKIELKPEIKLQQNKRGKKVLAIARMKIAGTEKNGTYLDIPFIMHRPMPDDSIIKWCYLIINKIGYRTVCEIQFTIESNTFKQAPAIRNDIMAINLGWRVENNGDIRVGTTFNGKNSENIIISENQRQKNDYFKTLIGYAETYFNSTKKEFSNWLKNNNVSDELKQLVENISHWKSHNKLRSLTKQFQNTYLSNGLDNQLWKYWRKDRLKLDDNFKKTDQIKEDLFTKKVNKEHIALSFSEIKLWCEKNNITDSNIQMAFYLMLWYKKDEHLINWARNIEKNLKRSRREQYRIFAKKISGQYEKIIIEDWNKSKTAKNPEVEEDNRTKQEEKANSIRQFVGISVLTDCLKNKFGIDLVKEKSNDISKICHKCKNEVKYNINGTEGRCYCSHCNSFEDIDYNAAVILYNRYCERFGGDQNMGPARKAIKSKKVQKKTVDNMMVET